MRVPVYVRSHPQEAKCSRQGRSLVLLFSNTFPGVYKEQYASQKCNRQHDLACCGKSSIHRLECTLSILVALSGRFAVPSRRLSVISWYSLSLGVRIAEGRLRSGIALISGFAVPVNSVRVILWHSFACVI